MYICIYYSGVDRLRSVSDGAVLLRVSAYRLNAAHNIINYNSYCFSRFHFKQFKVQIREILTRRIAHIFFTAQSIFFYF